MQYFGYRARLRNKPKKQTTISCDDIIMIMIYDVAYHDVGPYIDYRITFVSKA